MPFGPENNNGFAMKIELLSRFVPTSVQKYRLTHTPDLTAFSPLFMEEFTEDRVRLVCPSENNSIICSSSYLFCDLTGNLNQRRFHSNKEEN